MVDGEALTSAALASAICSGDSPRATSDLIRPIMYSNSASSRSTPILDSRSSASASACALAAEYSQRHGRPQWYLRNLHRCSNAATTAASGTPCQAPWRPCRPCPALATQCGCAPPRRRPSTAIGPAPGHLPAGLALVEASLDRGALGPVQPAVRVGCLLPHAFPFSGGLRPPPQKESSNSAGHVRLSSRTKAAFG